MMMGAQDPTSQSNYHQISTKHFLLDWSIDFQEKVTKGSITHELTVHESDVEEVMCVRYLVDVMPVLMYIASTHGTS
jgi:hypothetical protein